MEPMIFGGSVLRMLSKAVVESPATATTERGSLYLLPRKSMGAIRLGVTFSKYLEFLETLDEKVQPKALWIVSVDDQNFQVVVNTAVEVRDGKTFVDGREVVFV